MTHRLATTPSGDPVKSRDRVLLTLVEGACTLDQLIAETGLSKAAADSALDRLVAAGQVSKTKMANQRRSGRPANLFSLPADGLISLGGVGASNAADIARLLGSIVYEHGQAALFVGNNRQGAVAIHGVAGFDAAVTRHAVSMVGMYRHVDGKNFEANAVVDDIHERLREIHAGHRVAV